MTEVYLVRHGETEWSLNGRHTSVTDLPLTDNGVRNAESLRGQLDPSDFGLILASPRRRAVQTAELAGFSGPYEPQRDDDLVEWFYGDYEGLTTPTIHEQDPAWSIFTGTTPGGETPAQISERLDRLIARLQSSGVERAICFGHGHCLRALALRWLQFDLAIGEQFPLGTGTVSVLGWAKGEPALERWNSRP